MRDIGQEILDGINEIKQGKQALRSTQRSQEKPNMNIPPCPCGGKARLHVTKYSEFPHSVKCDVCGAEGCGTVSAEEAVELWARGLIMGVKGNLLPRIMPCPCGGEAKLQKTDGDLPYSVVCLKCGAQGCSTFSSDFAVYQWEEGYITGVNGERLSRSLCEN